MRDEDLEAFDDLLEQIISAPGDWREKRARLEDTCNLGNIQELCAWFAEDPKDDA